eukprot:jgi/Picsp_1/6074/NSC_03428-R1_fg-gap repeat protein
MFDQMTGNSLFGSNSLVFGNEPAPVLEMGDVNVAANETVTANSTDAVNETLTPLPEVLYPPPIGLDTPATNGTNSSGSLAPPAYNETMPGLNETLSTNETSLFPAPELENVSPPFLVSPPPPISINQTDGNSTSPIQESPGLEPVGSPPSEESPGLEPVGSPPSEESPGLEPVGSPPSEESPGLEPVESPQIPSPPPPPIQGGPGGDTCSGYAYSGYMSGCQVYIDANQDSAKTFGEPSDTTNDGYFSIPVPSTNFQGFVVRLDPAESNFMGPVSAGSQVCHDMATLVPQRLPLASPILQRCDGSSPIAVTSLSTLLTVPGVTDSAIRELFSLHESVTIGQQDFLRRALDGSDNAFRFVQADSQVKNIVLQISESLTNNPSVYKKIATVCFASIGRLVAPAAQAARDDQVTKHRRQLYQATPSSLSDPSALVYSLLSDVIQTLEMDDSIEADDILYLTNQTKMDIISSIMNIDSISSLATTLDDMFKISIVIEQQILPAVKTYVRGETSSDTFQNTTSLLSLSSALNATQLPDGYVIDPLNPPMPPAPAPDDNDESSDTSGLSSGQKLALGLGLGLGIPCCLALLAYAARAKRSSVHVQHNQTQSSLLQGVIVQKNQPQSSSHDITCSPSHQT